MISSRHRATGSSSTETMFSMMTQGTASVPYVYDSVSVAVQHPGCPALHGTRHPPAWHTLVCATVAADTGCSLHATPCVSCAGVLPLQLKVGRLDVCTACRTALVACSRCGRRATLESMSSSWTRSQAGWAHSTSWTGGTPPATACSAAAAAAGGIVFNRMISGWTAT